MKSEMKMLRDRDREVKFQRKSREFSRNETLAGYCPLPPLQLASEGGDVANRLEDDVQLGHIVLHAHRGYQLFQPVSMWFQHRNSSIGPKGCHGIDNTPSRLA